MNTWSRFLNKDQDDEILKRGILERIEKKPEEEKEKIKVIELFEQIYGVGETTATAWYDKGYRTLEDLKNVKMTKNQRLGYEYFKDLNTKIPREEIDRFKVLLDKLWNGRKFLITGSYRREEKEIGDIDIVAQDGVPIEDLIKPLRDAGLIIATLSEGETKFIGLIKPEKVVRKMDIRFIEADAWPYTILYFSSGSNINKEMRTLAHKYGLILNEFGLFDKNDNKYPAFTEKDIFDYLNLEYLSPIERKGNAILKEKSKKVSPDITKEIILKREAELSRKEKEFIRKQEEIKNKTEEEQIRILTSRGEETPPLTPEMNKIVNGKWIRPEANLFIWISDNITSEGNIAAFDLDHTLVASKSGQFPKSVEDNYIMTGRREAERVNSRRIHDSYFYEPEIYYRE